MKFFVLLFGAAGFTLVMVTGFTVGRQPDLVLRDAALGCLGAAFLGRWFGSLIEQAFTQVLAVRRAEQLAEDETPPAPPPPAARPRPAASPAASAPAATRAR